MQKCMPRQVLTCLLRTALWTEVGHSHSLQAKAGVKVLKEAERQTVAALVLDAMDRCGVKLPTEVVLGYYSYSAQIVQGNRQLNAAAKALGRLMDENRIDYAIVKGQVVGSLYPNPLLRQSGDIDFYCDSGNFEQAKTVIGREWGIVFDDTDSDKHLHFDYHGVTFEMHFSLTSFYDKRKDAYWERLLREDKGGVAAIDGYEVRTLSPIVHALYVFQHLYHHLMELGVGLRQFCDLAVLLHYCKADIDQTALRAHLKALGMERAFRACGSVLVDRLGLPEEDFGYSLTSSDRRYGQRILDVVFYRGNMGHYNKRSGFHGWKHNIEATAIKVSHFMKFMPLAPGYSSRWLTHELGRKVWMKM